MEYYDYGNMDFDKLYHLNQYSQDYMKKFNPKALDLEEARDMSYKNIGRLIIEYDHDDNGSRAVRSYLENVRQNIYDHFNHLILQYTDDLDGWNNRLNKAIQSRYSDIITHLIDNNPGVDLNHIQDYKLIHKGKDVEDIDNPFLMSPDFDRSKSKNNGGKITTEPEHDLVDKDMYVDPDDVGKNKLYNDGFPY